MKRKTIIIAAVSVVLAVALFLILSNRRNQNDLAQNYDFFTVKRMDLNETVDATGNVLALEKKDLYADYEGAVEVINVKGGDSIKKGDVLITIKSSVLKEEWQEANADLKQAELNLIQASALLSTELALNQVQKTNAIQLESYTHQVSLYREQVNQVKTRLKALEEKNDGYYRADNEKLFIRAPFDGQVAWINVQPGDKVMPQTLLGTAIKPDRFGVEAWIDQNDIDLVKPGQKATVNGKDLKQSENTGTVTEISVLGEENEEDEVVNFPVRIKLTGTPQGLQPGMSVDVTVLAEEHSDVLAIPAGSVTQKDGRDLAQVKRGNRLVSIAVELGLKQGKYWEVKSGLKVGDQVAVAKPELLAKQSTGSGGAHTRMPGFGR